MRMGRRGRGRRGRRGRLAGGGAGNQRDGDGGGNPDGGRGMGTARGQRRAREGAGMGRTLGFSGRSGGNKNANKRNKTAAQLSSVNTNLMKQANDAFNDSGDVNPDAYSQIMELIYSGEIDDVIKLREYLGDIAPETILSLDIAQLEVEPLPGMAGGRAA